MKVIQLNSKTGPFSAVIQAGHWQAAEPNGETALCSCTVGPGFDFEDHAMIEDCTEVQIELKQLYPNLIHLL